MSVHGWIQTYTLKKFFPLAPRPEDICIEDIAHALSLQCRFSGHTSGHCSVAQHSVLVSIWVPSECWRWGLLHDASEAYLVDLPRPLKRLPEFAPYREAETRLMAAVASRFGLEGEEPAVVREVDRRMCYTEARDLFTGVHPDWQWQAQPFSFNITPWSPAKAELDFLHRFRELWGSK